jgi:hypothetical protein
MIITFFIDQLFRITRYLDSWPKIEKWYNKFGVLARVDASQGARSVYLEVEKILEDTLAKVKLYQKIEACIVCRHKLSI